MLSIKQPFFNFNYILRLFRFMQKINQNLRRCHKKGNSYNGFAENTMNDWLSDIKNTDLWQVAQHKITAALVERWAHRVKVGSLLNNRLLELSIIKPKPQEPMYADYWKEDVKRARYMNLYTGKIFRDTAER